MDKGTKTNEVANQSTKPVISDLNNPDFYKDVSSTKIIGRNEQSNSRAVNVTPEWEKAYADTGEVVSPELDFQKYNADNQSVLSQAGHAAMHFGAGLVGGGLMAAGTDLDVEQSVNMALGTEKEYSNLLYDLGKSLIEKTQQNFPIYEKEPGTVNFADTGWWAMQFGQTGMTAGIAAETFALTALTSEIGLGEQSILNSARKINSIKTLLSTVKNSSRLKYAAMTFGLLRRHNEGVIEAADSFNQIRTDLQNQGIDHETATNEAAKGASLTYRLNLPLMVMDALMFQTMTFNPVSGEGVGLMEKALGGIESKAGRFIAKHGTEAASESFEEGWQQVAQNEGLNAAQVAVGKKAPSSFSERFSEYLKSDELWNSAIGGAFGGPIMSGITHAMKQVPGIKQAFNNDVAKNGKIIHQNFIQDITKLGLQLNEEINKADKSGNTFESNRLRRQLGLFKALSGLHLDNLLGEDTAFDSYIGYLNDVLEAANNNDTEALSYLGYKPSLAQNTNDLVTTLISDEDAEEKRTNDFIGNIVYNFPEYIQDANRIKELYDSAKEYNHKDALVHVVSNQFELETANRTASELDSHIEHLKSKIVDFENLSENGKILFNVGRNLIHYDEQQKYLQDKIEQSSDEAEKKGFQAALEANNKKKAELSNLLLSVKDELTDDDKQILKSIHSNNEYDKALAQKVAIDNHIVSKRKMLEIWKDKKFQAKSSTDKYLDLIDKVDTISELENIAHEMKKDGVRDENVKKKLQDKVTKLKLSEETERIKNTPETLTFDQSINNVTNPTATQENNPPIEHDPTGGETIESIEAKMREKGFDPVHANNSQRIKSNMEYMDLKSKLDELKKNNSQTTNTNETSNQSSQEEGQKGVLTANPFVPSKNQDLDELSTLGADMIGSIIDGSDYDMSNDAFSEPIEVNNKSDEFKDSVKSKFQTYYDAVKRKLEKEPSFQEILESLIEDANQKLDEVERAFNVLKMGWELNNYHTTDFNKVYQYLFGGTRDKALDLLALISQAAMAANQDNIPNEEVTIETNGDNGTGNVQKETMPDGTVVVKHLSPFRTVETTEKLAFNAVDYIRNIRPTETGYEIEYETTGTDVNKNGGLLLHDYDAVKPGTKFKISIPTDVNNKLVTDWNEDYSKKETMTFGEWCQKHGVTEGSQEWINKVPVLVTDENNKELTGVYVHDTEWYNVSNIGFSDNPSKQQEIIKEAREKLQTLRNQLHKSSSIDITISQVLRGNKVLTKKENGTHLQIPINQANPQSKIGVVTLLGDINVGSNEPVIFRNSLINKQKSEEGIEQSNLFRSGNQVEVRRWGNDKEGNPTYIAFPINRYKITPEVVMSIAKAMQYYSLQNNDKLPKEERDELNRIHAKLKEIGFDLRYTNDFEKYIRLFIPTILDSNIKDANDAVNKINNNSKMLTNSPWMVIQKGRIIFGVKGVMLRNSKIKITIDGKLTEVSRVDLQNIITSNPNRSDIDYLKEELKKLQLQDSYIFQYPNTPKNEQEAKMQKEMTTNFLTTVYKYLPQFNQNIDIQSLNSKVAFISGDGKVTNTGKNYHDYLKDNLTTNVLSFNIGTNDKPKWITATQPVIHFTYNKEVQETPIEAQVTSEIQKSTEKTEAQKLLDAQRQEFLNMGLSESDIDAMLNGDEFAEPRVLTDEEIKQISARSKKIGLSSREINILQRFIARAIESKFDARKHSKFTIKELHDYAKQVYDSAIKSNRDLITTLLSKQGGDKFVEKFAPILNFYNAVDKNWQSLVEDAMEVEVKKNLGLTEFYDDSTNNDEQRAEESADRLSDYSKTSLEENPAKTIAPVLRRLIAQLPEYDSNGEVNKLTGGITIYPGFNFYFNKLKELLHSPSSVGSNYQDVIDRLNQASLAGHHWVGEVLKLIENSDQIVKNALCTFAAQDSTAMEFARVDPEKEQLKVFETNAHEVTREIITGWTNSLFVAPITEAREDGSYQLNKIVAKRLLEQFAQWKAENRVPTWKEAQSWLSDFGIDLANNTAIELSRNGYYVMIGDKWRQMKFAEMFTKSTTNYGVFGHLAARLELLATKDDTSYDIEDNSPISDASEILKYLANLEKDFSPFNYLSNMFRDGSKLISGISPGKYITQIIDAFKYDEQWRNDKLNLSFNGQSYLLNLANQIGSVRSKIRIKHLGINAIKKKDAKLYKDNEINSVSDADHEICKLTFFQDTKQGNKSSELTFKIANKEYTLKFRMASMFSLTSSDKKIMTVLKAPVLDLESKNFTKDENGYHVNHDVMEFLFSQLVEPELKRIINHHVQTKSNNPNTRLNQEGYNIGAQLFHLIPELNNIKIGEFNLPKFLSEKANDFTGDNYTKLITEIRSQCDEILESIFKKEVETKMQVWKENGFYKEVDSDSGIRFVNKLLDKTYLTKFNKEENNDKIVLAAYDFVINSMIANANNFMLIANDPANYVENKHLKNLFNNGDIFSPISENSYGELSAGPVSINIGKRLALQLAPGMMLSNSEDDNYVQLVINDPVAPSVHGVSELIELYYGKVSEQTKQLIGNLNNADKKLHDAALNSLSSQYPKIAEFLKIKLADAQEYTTAKEAIDVLYRQGKFINEEQYKTLMDKINRQKEAEANGQAIPKDALLSSDELQLVLNPVKPVFTGDIVNTIADVARVVYVKTSSFPLLPQLTLGTELNGLRRRMEEIETKTGKNVRAAYASGVKVGAPRKELQLNVWGHDGRFIDFDPSEMIDGIIKSGEHSAAIVLPRKYFRIQQDVPFKEDKEEVTIMSQMMRVIFANGISNVSDKIFTYNGEQVSGQKLFKDYNTHFVNWISKEREKLYSQLGINVKTGVIANENKIIEKLQKILKDEALSRGYTSQDVAALSLMLNDITKKPEFVLPIWMAPNSNRYESLLNAIVANRLISMHLPGASFVLGSEVGFKWSQPSDLSSEQQSNIVYTSAFVGELKSNQIIVPSKFRNNDGELIDLLKDGYAIKNSEGRWILDESKIDKSLLELAVARIPTSGHMSMANVEIAGFVPYEMGDLAIATMEFVTQMGSDFDVDKLYSYQLWTKMEDNGQIRPLDKFDILDSEVEGENEKAQLNLDIKLSQNEIVKIYKSILASKNSQVQSKIRKVLSLDFTSKQAEMIESLTQSSDYKNFTILSDEYQKQKMYLGAAGKSGIGVYSNYLVFQALAQQTEKGFTLRKEVLINDKIELIDLVLRIGDANFTARFGQDDPEIMDLMGERQNTATDNEKEQTMGKVSVNDMTINVDAMLQSLYKNTDTIKVDDKPFKISVSYWLLSQPIIREYVKELKNTKSTIHEFDKQAKEKVVNRLYEKYGGSLFSVDGVPVDIRQLSMEDIDNERAKLKGQELYNNIVNTKPTEEHNKFQQTVLHLFLELDSYSQAIGSAQRTLNIQRTRLGKSIFEMQERYDALGNTINNRKINGISQIIGDVITEDEFYDENGDLAIQHYLEDGYIEYNYENKPILVKPNTYIGALVVYGTKTGHQLWNNFFPHSNLAIKNKTSSIINMIINEEDSTESKRVDLKTNIFESMRQFLYSNPQLGLTDGLIQDERRRLMMDDEKNNKFSLASYMKEMFKNQDEQFKQAISLVQTNKLIGSFTYERNKNGQPSRIYYNNTQAEDFIEEYKYDALKELIDVNKSLPDFNGKPYSTRLLAQDLITYSFICAGGIQRATEFVKYVPVDYLVAIGFAKTMREYQSAAVNPNSSLWNTILGQTETDSSDNIFYGRFIRQWAQHNAKLLPQINTEQLKDNTKIKRKTFNSGSNLSNLLTFQIANEASPKPYVSIYNDEIRQGNRYQVYEYNGVEYVRIPTLGGKGYVEYSATNNFIIPLTKQVYVEPSFITPHPTTPTTTLEERVDKFKLTSNLKGVIENLSELNIPGISEIASELAKFTDTNTAIEIGETPNNRNAVYLESSNKIIINKNYLINEKDDRIVATTILHEFVHSITVKELLKYFDKNTRELKIPESQLPLHVRKLVRVYNQVATKLGKEITDFKIEFNKTKVITNETRHLYAGLDIFEFTAMIMSDPIVQRRMDEIEYEKSGESLLDRFISVIKNVFEKIGLPFKENSTTAHAIDGVFRLLNNDNDDTLKVPTSPFGNILTPDSNDIPNILKEDYDDSAEFAEPKNSIFDDWQKTENKTPCGF